MTPQDELRRLPARGEPLDCGREGVRPPRRIVADQAGAAGFSRLTIAIPLPEQPPNRQSVQLTA